jgi:subtilisin family serine protease
MRKIGIAILVATAMSVAAVVGIVLRRQNVAEPARGGMEVPLPRGAGVSLKEAPRFAPRALPETRQVSPGAKELFHELPAVVAEETVPDGKGEFTRRRIVRTDDEDPYVLVESHFRRDSASGSEKMLFSKAMVADQVMVQLRPDADVDALKSLVSRYGGQLIQKIYGTEAYLVRLPGVDLNTISNAAEFFSAQTGIVATVDCNSIAFPTAIPNDTFFTQQWNLLNTGQSSGTPGADIAATKAWNITVGSTNVIVAVLDSGVMYTHEDLSANMWTNRGEIPGNGVDDDGNGLIDDVRGWDFGSGDNDPMDEFGHGTAVAGVLGAKGSNTVGIAGVCWNVQIMPVKMSYSPTSGASHAADMVSAIYYAASNGAHVINFSYGNYSFNSLMQAAIARAQQAGALFVTTAGNDGNDSDVIPYYPCAYTNANIISVAAMDRNDQLWTGTSPSGYGATTVDLGAPGVSVPCTMIGGYGTASGTSFGAPQVVGVAVLLKSVNPSWGWRELKEAILNNVDPQPTLSGKCVSGGRLNAYKALIGSIGLAIDRGPSSKVNLQWNALKNAAFQLQGRTNLLNGAWYNIGSSILGTGTTTNILKDVSADPELFFRFTVQ